MLYIAIIYHSGFGHTAKVAEAVAEGAVQAGAQVMLINVEALDEAGWGVLDAADAIIFGSPTYMGGVSAPFKAFIDGASKRWFAQSWKNKIAAGFTNSGSYSGDNLSTLFQLAVNAMQHSMIWVGTGIMAATARGTEGPDSSRINRVGSFMGLATQSNNEPTDIAPPIGDLQTARLFGARIAQITRQFVQGGRV